MSSTQNSWHKRILLLSRGVGTLWTHPFTVIGMLALLSVMIGLCACTHPTSGRGLSPIKARRELLVGVNYNSPPLAFLNSKGKLQGYDIDLLKEISRRLLGNTEAVRFYQVFASTRVIALNTGSLDMVATALSITPARARYMDFSEPYLIAHQAVLVPQLSPIKHLNDLAGKTVLLVGGTTSETTIKAHLPHARYQSFPTLTEALDAFKAGQGEALSSDDFLLYGFLSKHCGFRLLPETLSEERYGLAFRKTNGTFESHSGSNNLKAEVNGALKAMQADGTLKRLQVKWLLPPQPLKNCSLP